MTPPMLDRFEALPLRTAEAIDLASIVVVAPHPDDESLGCGGLMASWRALGREVAAVVVSDGVGSHPDSAAFPPQHLRAVREAEALEALATLGVEGSRVRFLGLPDRFVPAAGAPGFDDAVTRLAAVLDVFRPDAVFAAWRRDPHGDHQAAWSIVAAAVGRLAFPCRPIAYPVWGWFSEDVPEGEGTAGWRLDVARHLALKRRAVACHRSQLGGLIHDDPGGFRLTPDVLATFDRPYEVFLEER